jgi:hypothetical protein
MVDMVVIHTISIVTSLTLSNEGVSIRDNYWSIIGELSEHIWRSVR